MPRGIPKKVHLYKLVPVYVGEFDSYRAADRHITGEEDPGGQHTALAIRRGGYTKGYYATEEKINNLPA